MTNIFISSSHFKHFNAISFIHMISGFDVKGTLNYYPTNKQNRRTHRYREQADSWQREGVWGTG